MMRYQPGEAIDADLHAALNVREALIAAAKATP